MSLFTRFQVQRSNPFRRFVAFGATVFPRHSTILMSSQYERHPVSSFPTFYNPSLYERLRTAGGIVLGCVATIVVTLSALSWLTPDT